MHRFTIDNGIATTQQVTAGARFLDLVCYRTSRINAAGSAELCVAAPHVHYATYQSSRLRR